MDWDWQHLGCKTHSGNEHLEKCMPPVHNGKNAATPTRLKKDILLQRCKVGRMQILFGFI